MMKTGREANKFTMKGDLRPLCVPKEEEDRSRTQRDQINLDLWWISLPEDERVPADLSLELLQVVGMLIHHKKG